MSTFDPKAFLNSQTKDAGDTNFIPIPEGDYLAIIDKVDAREAGDNAILDVTYSIQNQEELAKNLGFEDKMVVRDSIFLDIEDGVLQFGPNQNVRLSRTREAVGQNNKGKPWGPQMLVGAGPVTIKVGIKPDKEDPSVQYNRITRVAAA